MQIPTDFRIDLDLAESWSPAAQAIAEQRPGLVAELAAVREDAIKAAAAIPTMDELRRRIADLHETAGAVTKRLASAASRSLLKTIYVEAAVKVSGLPDKISELESCAFAERRFAKALNEMLDEAANRDEELRTLMTRTSGPAMVAELTIHLDGHAVAQFLAQHAFHVAWQVIKDGKDLRTAADAEQVRALRIIVSLPDHLYSNGVGSIYRSREVLEAKAARLFCRTVALHLRTDEYDAIYS
ncbi:hypothetical protein ACFWYW_47045 [Nonomuraea sp. NPDC059023]|uniref:hypothetical protein n=1 Tax=unclassified Nonomuraea TaxID=2593643 RepID=UPI00367BDE54